MLNELFKGVSILKFIVHINFTLIMHFLYNSKNRIHLVVWYDIYRCWNFFFPFFDGIFSRTPDSNNFLSTPLGASCLSFVKIDHVFWRRLFKEYFSNFHYRTYLPFENNVLNFSTFLFYHQKLSCAKVYDVITENVRHNERHVLKIVFLRYLISVVKHI